MFALILHYVCTSTECTLGHGLESQLGFDRMFTLDNDNPASINPLMFVLRCLIFECMPGLSFMSGLQCEIDD